MKTTTIITTVLRHWLASPGRAALLLALALGAGTSARASTFTWAQLSSGNASGSWANQADWTGATLPTTTGDTADFSQLAITATSTVTLDGNQSINALIFGNTNASPAANWTLSAGTPSTSTLTLGGTTPTITVENLGSGKSATISSVITGTSGLTLAGSGQLTLSGSNTYSGGTIVSSGALNIGVVGTYSSPNVVNGATGTGNVTLQPNVSVGNTSANNFWYVPQLTIQGPVNLVNSSRLNVGISTLDLSGGQQRVNVNGKSLVITNAPNGTSGVTTGVEGTGYSAWDINNNSVGTMTVQNGTLDLETTAFSGGNGGAYGAFDFASGSGFMSFPGNGSMIVGSNVLLFVYGSFSTATATSPQLTINSGGFVNMRDNTLTVNSLAGGGNLALSLVATNTTAKTLTINGTSGTTTFSGVMQNGPAPAVLSVSKTGGSTQVLSGQNTYTGSTTVSGGTLQLAGGSGNVLADNSTLILSGGTLDLNGQTETVNILTGSTGSSVITDSSGSGLGMLTLTNTGTSGTIVNSGDTLTLAGGTVAAGQYFVPNGGTLNVNGGTLIVPNELLLSYSVANGVVNLNSGLINTLTVSFGNNAGTYYLNGGTLQCANIKTRGTAPVNIFFNGVTVQYLPNTKGFVPPFFPYATGGNGALVSGQNAYISTNGVTFDSTNASITISCVLQSDFNLNGAPDGGLTKAGTGTLTLSGANTYIGPTSVSDGTLMVSGSLTGGEAVSVGPGATLAGNGAIQGATTVLAGGTVQPGLGGADTSTMTINNNLTLSGNAVFTLNKNNGQTAAQIAGLSTVTYGGTLTVNNAGPAVQLGDSFTLFQASTYAGFFAATNLPALGGGLGWVWTPSNGTLYVASVIPTTPTNITYSVSGSTLTLSWPGSYVGWLAQSNSVALADTNYWFDIPGSDGGTSLNIPIDPSQTNVFYRLRLP